MRSTRLLLLALVLLPTCWGQVIGLYSSGSHTGTITRTVELTPVQQSRTYLVTYIMTAGINVVNIFNLSVTFEDSVDGVNWIIRDRSVQLRDMETGPVEAITFSATARIENPRRFVRLTVQSGQSVVSASATLTRQ